MRPICTFATVILLAAVALTPVHAADLRNFNDAALHAIQFIEDNGTSLEGWAVGDDGVVWHTTDGGNNWDLLPTGTRASLRSLQFLTPWTGWVAGREELPNGGGSVGVLLYTVDGGSTWRRVLFNALPGLNLVHFVDEKTGFVTGDGTEPYPSGVFKTDDGGRKWQPVPGPRCPSWFAGCWRYQPTKTETLLEGTLFGSWLPPASIERSGVSIGKNDPLDGRTVRGVHLNGSEGLAVGEGGLVLTGSCGMAEWGQVDLNLPPDVQESWDLHAIHGSGTHFWAVGRPGSVVLHTPDAGHTWEVQRTGYPLPLNGVYFSNETTGWAVGEFGTIIGTRDGGKTWTLRRRGGQRAAALFIHARSAGLPADTVALLGGQEGYLTTAVRVTSPDSATAAPGRVTEATRFSLANRQAGGAAAEAWWQFPIASQTATGDPDELVKAWNEAKNYHNRAAEHMLRQLVLAVRIWRPDVIITDNLDAKKGCAADALVAEAVREAFERAADPKQFPDQLAAFGLEPWKPSKLYGCWDDHKTCNVALDLTAASAPLQATVRDFATGPAGLLAERAAVVPANRCFRLLASHLEGAANHKDLMEGLDLPADGTTARRKLSETLEVDKDLVKAIRQRESLRAISEAPPNELTNPNQLLAQLGTMTRDMPPDLGAAAIHGAAAQYVRIGQWDLASEAYRLLIDRYPLHPLAIDGYRWLIRYNGSSEARRRHELGQFLALTIQQGAITPNGQSLKLPETETNADRPGDKPPAREIIVPKTEMRKKTAEFALLCSPDEVCRRYQSCIDMEKQLIAFGPIACFDPTIQFPLQAARRNLGQFDEAQQWYKQFAARQPNGPWRDAALAELWLAERTRETPPKPLAVCRYTEAKPYLDGKLDDACWQSGQPLKLRDAGPPPKAKDGNKVPEVSELDQKYPTEVRLAYDHDYLYLAVHCTYPEGRQVPVLKNRQHDTDLRGYDRVSLLLDLDRDYSTCFHLQVDQRGCVCDDCWGDKSWDPRWFVAVQSDATSWTVEAAIPRLTLTGDPLTHGHAWAFNAVRVIPGAGVQSFSQPAEAPEEAMRLEGMGLMMFMDESVPRMAPPAK